ncbi:MAG: UDP-2,4-diacetamido-2,4,6-trideoxy-beta-L-altropyranose hydrolase [Ardenticatenaceae bacterium]
MMNLLIRADASARIGAGHLMRCLALAQGWQARGGQVTFITACESVGLLRRLKNEGFKVITLEQAYPHSADWDRTSQLLANYPGAWIVLDGYHFDPTYQRQIKESAHPLLLIDDTAHLEYYHADIILNQNINAEQLPYSCDPDTRLLRGTGYVLLRSEFLSWQAWQRTIPQVAHKVLVTLGGGDANNQTLKVINALQEVNEDGLEAVVVVGASNPHFPELQSAVHHSRVPIRLIRNANNMAELMAWADIAVSAGGSTCWELAFMGLPNIILVLADNQRGIAEGLHDLGIAINMGWYAGVSELELAHSLKMLIFGSERRQKMSKVAQKLVDGKGSDRVVSKINKLTSRNQPTEQARIRAAGFQDAELLWQWANDPIVRANSFHPEAIPLDEHIEWYKRKVESPETRIFILELNRVPVAQIRYDRVDAETAKIGFSVLYEYRGKGLGTRLLVMTSTLACQELNVKRLKGVVFTSNKASARAFTKAGFECVGQEYISDKLCYLFVWKCSKKNETCYDKHN